MTDSAAIRTQCFARTLARSGTVNIPCPDEPGVRIVGFKFLDAQAGLVEALFALDIIRKAFIASADETMTAPTVAKTGTGA